MTNEQEKKWIDAARRGDPDAFEQLVLAYEKRVLALYWPDNTTAASYKTAAVWLNGKSFPAAEKLIRENVTEVPENAATTVIYVQNTPQVHTVGDRLKLLTGCGVPQLDELAAKIIRGCMARDENLSGEIAFV